MKKAIVFCFAIILVSVFLLSRTSDSEARVIEPDDPANGWWILHEYHDRIMNNKCIGAFSFEEPVYTAIILKVTSDSVFTAGSLLPDKRYLRSDRGDTIVRFGHFQKMPLVYNNKKRELIITFVGSDSTVQTFHYRHLRSNEHFAITRGLFEGSVKSVNGIPVDNTWALSRNYDTFFRKQFFSGKYTGVDNSSVMLISDNGSMSGYENWNSCEIDNCFGTTHWFGKQDRVRFIDTTTKTHQDYNWHYRGDTLVLRKYVGEYLEVAKRSSEEIHFLRGPMK